MTPAEHAKAIERAANIYATAAAAAALNKPGGSAMALEARESLREAIRAGVGADLFVSDNKMVEAPDVVAELEEVKTVCAEAYQVVGVLLADAGRFDSPEATKILDNLSEQRLRHTDVLPWASKAVPGRFFIETTGYCPPLVQHQEGSPAIKAAWDALFAPAPKP